ncbi:MAG TPA: radical SAM protein [Thermoguttaceae bacterium]|nr:radical SAM protein [Thermoguttaceae bacterium]
MRRKPFNYRYRQFVMGTLRFFLQWYAKLTGKRFCCRTLAGIDGVFVNSDMTVSCNCQDADGTGQLGNLRESSLEEILGGETAAGFRRGLVGGKLPIHRCAACFQLRMVTPEKAAAHAENYRLPRGLSVENTCCCNLRCLSCCREILMETRKEHFLSLDDVEVISRTLQRFGAESCSYTNLGEPFLRPSIRRELEIIREYNPGIAITTCTNGTLIDTDDKREAALLTDKITVSLDGISTEMVNRYQRGGDFDKAYDNLKKLVAFRNEKGRKTPLIHWLYVVFRWNDAKRDIEKAVTLARHAGVDYMTFRFARTPWYGISWRYLLSPFFRSLGEKAGWRHRRIWFSESARNDWERLSTEKTIATAKAA